MSELERGESGEIKTLETSAEEKHQEAEHPIEVLYHTQSPKEVDKCPVEELCIEEDEGPRAVARLKSYDPRFNFYPAFLLERSMVLDFRAEKVQTLGSEIQAQLERLKSRYNIVDPYSLPRTNRHRKKFMRRMSFLAEQLDKYSTACVNSKIINERQDPEGNSLLQLQDMLEKRSRGLLPQYDSDNTHAFRMLEPRRGGPIEKSVKVLMPVNRLGKWLLRPFLSSSTETEDLTFHRYGDENISWLVGAILLLGICIFLVLPLALLSYYESNHAVKTVLVLVMCVLVSLLARAIETDEARQIILVCGYSAIMSGFLSQS